MTNRLPHYDVDDDGRIDGSSIEGIEESMHYVRQEATTQGISDEAAFQDIYQNQAASGDTIKFEGDKTFTFTSQHTIGIPLTLDLYGATLELEGVTDAPQIQFTPDAGTRASCVTDRTDLTADVNEGDYTLSVGDTSFFSRGDYLMMFDGGSVAMGAVLDNEHHLQISRVENIPDSTTLEMSSAAHRAFSSTNESDVNEGNEVARIKMMENPKIIGGTVTSGGGLGDGWAFQFNFCKNPVFRDISVQDHLKYDFLFSECIGGLADHCEDLMPQTFAGGEAERFYIRRCADTTIRDCTVRKCRRGVDIIAGTYNTLVDNCKIYNPTNAGVSVHQNNPAGKLHVRGGEIRTTADSTHNVIGHGVSASNQLSELIVEAVDIQATRDGVSALTEAGGSTLVSNCTFKPAQNQSNGSGVQVKSSNVTVTGCTFDEVGVGTSFSEYPVTISPHSSVSEVKNVTIDAEFRIEGAGRAIQIDTREGSPIDGVKLRGHIDDHGTSNQGVRVNPDAATISNLDISMDMPNISDHAIVVAHGLGAGFGAIRIHDCSIISDRHPISTWGDGSNSGTLLHISDCYLEGGESADTCLDLDQPYDYLFISSCVMLNPSGSDGISSTATGVTTRYSNNYPTL